MAKVLEKLRDAIHSGDIVTAQNIAAQLSKLHVNLDIDVEPSEEQSSQSQQVKVTEFNVKVQVEDRESAGTSFNLHVRSDDKIEDLKKRVWDLYKFPMQVQRWIINKKIPDDKLNLMKCGVQGPATLYLYLVPAYSVKWARGKPNLGNVACVNVEGNDSVFYPVPDPTLHLTRLPYQANKSPHATIPKDFDNIEVVESFNNDVTTRLTSNMGDPVENDERENKEEENDDPDSEFDFSGEEEDEVQAQTGWHCPHCTFLNITAHPICKICDSARPKVDVLGAAGGDAANVAVKCDLKIEDRVIWMSDLGPERGTVKWVGTLPDLEGNDITVGVNFDNPVGTGTGKYREHRLFFTEAGHAGLMPLEGLAKDEDVLESDFDFQESHLPVL